MIVAPSWATPEAVRVEPLTQAKMVGRASLIDPEGWPASVVLGQRDLGTRETRITRSCHKPTNREHVFTRDFARRSLLGVVERTAA